MDSSRRLILLALDESSHSIATLTWSFKQLLRSGDHLCVVACVASDSERAQATTRISTLLRAEMDLHPIQSIELGIRILVCPPSNVGKQLCALALAIEPNLVIVGSAGKTSAKGLLMGSVSQYVLSHCNCPVVVARMETLTELKAQSQEQMSFHRDEYIRIC